MFDINPPSAIALLLCIFGLAGIAWRKRDIALAAARQAWKTRPPRRICVEERVALTPQHTIHMIRFESRTILVATTPTSLVVLDAAPKGGRNRNTLKCEVQETLK